MEVWRSSSNQQITKRNSVFIPFHSTTVQRWDALFIPSDTTLLVLFVSLTFGPTGGSWGLLPIHQVVWLFTSAEDSDDATV